MQYAWQYIAIPEDSKTLNAASVARTEALILTILLPTRIAVRNCSGFSSNLETIFAFLFPVSARCLILILPTESSAVSESEKKAENTISTDMIIISIVIHESIGYLINSYNIDKVKNLTANGWCKILWCC
ncbi:MAG: hypothetical protein O8C62_08910 [Candidatus Methanoperedens sp.]|nr:hypothetical protein [Candidatus Methanoperedens sp.]